jgi:hypothetical protein
VKTGAAAQTGKKTADRFSRCRLPTQRAAMPESRRGLC